MIIRPETQNENTTIEALIYQAFKGHPHHTPGAEPTEHLIYRNLKERNKLIYSSVAIINQTIIGYLACSTVLIDGQDKGWLGLGPIAVRPDVQRQNIGSQLIQKAIGDLSEQGYQGMVVLGEPDYYHRFGFKQNPNLTLPDVPEEYFLTRQLNQTSQNSSGIVTYDSAFYIEG